MRRAGILMPITSLPSPYGIGTMGEAAREFVRFLHKAGQSYWQILPICPTSYGDSPYQSFSSYAGNPYMIDLDDLCEAGLLEKDDYENIDWGDNQEKADYGLLYKKRFSVLKKATKVTLPIALLSDAYILFKLYRAEVLDYTAFGQEGLHIREFLKKHSAMITAIGTTNFFGALFAFFKGESFESETAKNINNLLKTGANTVTILIDNKSKEQGKQEQQENQQDQKDL